MTDENYFYEELKKMNGNRKPYFKWNDDDRYLQGVSRAFLGQFFEMAILP